MPLRFTPINYPASTATQAIGVNNNDVVTGLYLDGGGTHPFTEQNGSYSTLPLDAGHSVTPFGVNDLGQYVGFFSDGAGQHGFLYSAGLYATIDDPNATGGTQAAGINDAGEIVGVYTDGTGEHGFLENNGTYITINAPGATTTLAVGINASGVISGTFMDSGGTAHGFIDNNGSFTVIDDPLATQGTQVLGINDHNQVVGTYKVNGVQHGFVWSNGTFTTIDDPAYTANEAVGINNAGQISGFGKIGLNDQGFLSSPLHVAPDDFSGDNMSDVLWRQSGGGLMAWQMNGGTIAGNGAVSFQGSPVAPDSSWTMVGTGDFSFDGNTDILWRQSTTGTLSEWLMNGSTITASNTLSSMPDQTWQVQSKPTSFV